MANSKSNIYPVQLQDLFDKRKLKDLYCFSGDWLSKSNLSWASQFCNRKAGWQNE